MDFLIQNGNYSQEAAGDNGNRFLIGNGYMGIRGTLDEHGKDQLAACNLAGIYDQVGNGWREPLNAPYPLTTTLSVGGEKLALPETEPVSHNQCLDFRYGLFTRETVWETAAGKVEVKSERFAHMAKCHQALNKYTVKAEKAMEVEITAAIDCGMWEIYGPLFEKIDVTSNEDTVFVHAFVQNGKDEVSVGR